jgi:hypothetical protein
MRGRLFIGALLALVLSGVYASANLVQFTVAAGGACGGTGTIAVDANSASNVQGAWSSGTTFAWNHTIASANEVLVVYPIDYGTASQSVTSVTFNSVALTHIAADVNGTSDSTTQRLEAWYIKNPATGTHSISVTWANSSSFTIGLAESFTNANQTTPIFASNTGPTASGVQDFTISTTATGGNKCWLSGVAFDRTGATIVGGTGTTTRLQAGDTATSADSGAAVTAGSVSLIWHADATKEWPGGIVVVVAPSP